MGFTRNIQILDLTTGGVSGIYNASDRSLKSLHCLYTESTGGYVEFTVQVSNDQQHFVNYHRLVSNVLAGATGTPPALGSQMACAGPTALKLKSSTVTGGMLFFSPDDAFNCFKVVATKINTVRGPLLTGKVKVWYQSIE